MKEIKGQLTAGKGSYAIVVSRFNEFITARLLSGAIDCLKRHGAKEEQMTVVWVPGACEIVVPAKKLAMAGKFTAVTLPRRSDTGTDTALRGRMPAGGSRHRPD